MSLDGGDYARYAESLFFRFCCAFRFLNQGTYSMRILSTIGHKAECSLSFMQIPRLTPVDLIAGLYCLLDHDSSCTSSSVTYTRGLKVKCLTIHLPVYGLSPYLLLRLHLVPFFWNSNCKRQTMLTSNMAYRVQKSLAA
jgi:hypothetical protein